MKRPIWKSILLSFAKVMEHLAIYYVPLSHPSPPSGGEDKGEGV
jgi:hypothetical protein